MSNKNLCWRIILSYKQGVAGSNPAPPTPIPRKLVHVRGLCISGYNIGKTNSLRRGLFAFLRLPFCLSWTCPVDENFAGRLQSAVGLDPG